MGDFFLNLIKIIIDIIEDIAIPIINTLLFRMLILFEVLFNNSCVEFWFVYIPSTNDVSRGDGDLVLVVVGKYVRELVANWDDKLVDICVGDWDG